MAIIPVHSRRPLPSDLSKILSILPPDFQDDGLSGFPDSILGWDIKPAGRAHDGAYCTRVWPPGKLDRYHREYYDAKLGEWIRAMLPGPLRLIGYVVFLAVYEVGGMKAFDSCGRNPYDSASTDLCRHGLQLPDWMRQ